MTFQCRWLFLFCRCCNLVIVVMPIAYRCFEKWRPGYKYYSSVVRDVARVASFRKATQYCTCMTKTPIISTHTVFIYNIFLATGSWRDNVTRFSTYFLTQKTHEQAKTVSQTVRFSKDICKTFVCLVILVCCSVLPGITQFPTNIRSVALLLPMFSYLYVCNTVPL